MVEVGFTFDYLFQKLLVARWGYNDIEAEPGARATTLSSISTTEFVKNSSYKGEIAENETYLISVGLQIKPVRLKLDGIAVEKIIPGNKPIVFFPGQITYFWNLIVKEQE